ncbi:MAG: hypothetical protein IPJ88_09870 [Myxococcales bacterium]|nr:MAG: hypothetical protein IPJ88_09870 [Myxococcales bacterium]
MSRLYLCFAFSIALLFAALSAPSTAKAYPRRFVERPLVLPTATLRLDATFPLVSVDVPNDDRINTFSMLLGLGVGVTPKLELGAVLLPQQLAGDFEYRNPSFYGLYKLLDTRIVDIAFRGDLYLPFDNAREYVNGAVMPFSPWFGDAAVGIPIRLHIADVARLDTGAHLGLVFTDPWGSRFTFPLQLSLQATEDFFIGPQTGIQVVDGDRVDIPFGIFAGTTFGPANRPILDLLGKFYLPDVDVGFDVFVLSVGLNIYLYL